MFILTKEEIAAVNAAAPFVLESPGTEILSVLFRTEPGFVRQVLPAPLQPASDPLGMALVSHLPNTSVGFGYYEAAVAVRASYRGEDGWFRLIMPVDDDIALISGRESAAIPKKMAESITLERDGSTVTGRVTRKGTEIITLQAELAAPGDPSLHGVPTTDLDGRPCFKEVSFGVKWSMTPDSRSLHYMPRVVRGVVLNRPRDDLMTGPGTVTLTSSSSDPLGEIPIRGIVRSQFGTIDATGLPGRVVGRVWNIRTLQRTMIRQDALAYMLDQGLLTSRDRQERKRLWKAIRRY